MSGRSGTFSISAGRAVNILIRSVEPRSFFHRASVNRRNEDVRARRIERCNANRVAAATLERSFHRLPRLISSYRDAVNVLSARTFARMILFDNIRGTEANGSVVKLRVPTSVNQFYGVSMRLGSDAQSALINAKTLFIKYASWTNIGRQSAGYRSIRPDEFERQLTRSKEVPFNFDYPVQHPPALRLIKYTRCY